MKIELRGSHYTYVITHFDEKDFPVAYDKKRFPNGFDAINIDCYTDGSLRQMFLSKAEDWITIEDEAEVEKIVRLIIKSAKEVWEKKKLESMIN
jgi:hypothetical protein